jgi:hypothetical protein
MFPDGMVEDQAGRGSGGSRPLGKLSFDLLMKRQTCSSVEDAQVRALASSPPVYEPNLRLLQSRVVQAINIPVSLSG